MDSIAHPDEMAYAPFRAPVARWLAARGDAPLPKSWWPINDDPLAEYRMDAHLTLSPLSVQYGDVGVALESLYGQPIAGKNLDELYNDWFRKRAYNGYRAMIEESRPVYERRAIMTLRKKLGYHKLHLPFGEEGITYALTYIVPLDANLKRRSEWESEVRDTPWL